VLDDPRRIVRGRIFSSLPIVNRVQIVIVVVVVIIIDVGSGSSIFLLGEKLIKSMFCLR
jgi:hypothetical protein